MNIAKHCWHVFGVVYVLGILFVFPAQTQAQVTRKGGQPMTPEENQVIFQRIWDELFNQRKLAVADELFASDFVNHAGLVQVTPTAPPALPPGPAPMKQLVTQLTTAFPDLHFTLEDIIAAGDKVVGRLHDEWHPPRCIFGEASDRQGI